MQRAADTAPYMRTACITRALEASHQPCGCAGNLMHNPLTRSSHLIVCLLQTDIHSPSATVFEALLFSATLRLERNVNERTKRAFAENVSRPLYGISQYKSPAALLMGDACHLACVLELPKGARVCTTLQQATLCWPPVLQVLRRGAAHLVCALWCQACLGHPSISHRRPACAGAAAVIAVVETGQCFTYVGASAGGPDPTAGQPGGPARHQRAVCRAAQEADHRSGAGGRLHLQH